MSLNINTIIHLEDEDRFVLLSETEYGGVKYFLAMGVDAENHVIPARVAILEEIIEEEAGDFDGGESGSTGEIYVDRVTDPELVVTLTGILKPLAVQDFRHEEEIDSK